jgi:hypothetical protein
VDHDPNAAAYAAARSGDKGGLDAYLTRSATGWAGGPPPWTVDDSGFRAMAVAIGRDPAAGRGTAGDRPAEAPRGVRGDPITIADVAVP